MPRDGAVIMAGVRAPVLERRAFPYASAYFTRMTQPMETPFLSLPCNSPQVEWLWRGERASPVGETVTPSRPRRKFHPRPGQARDMLAVEGVNGVPLVETKPCSARRAEMTRNVWPRIDRGQGGAAADEASGGWGPPRILKTVRQYRWGVERDNVALSEVVADAEMQTSCRRCSSPAAGMFGEDYSVGVPLGLGRPNSTDCAPFSATIERKPILCTRQPSHELNPTILRQAPALAFVLTPRAPSPVAPATTSRAV